ncbi:MAG TPA: ankyrin repeat domain-containing protein [Candidatus Limnocylindria bacterium]|jgi:ankyrin repeat protein|nr:ankyrin repeat domain-containing protein [Candidatus Limnocylindria bacterium]
MRIALAALAAALSFTLAPAADAAGAPSRAAVVDAHRYDAEWFAAARAGRTDILQALHAAHYPLETRTPEGYTALILAAYDGHPAALHYLLAAGANPCAADRNGNTALMGALFKGETAIARTLMRTDCKIDQTNNAGETALSFAALFGRLHLLHDLVARGADPNHIDARGGTALRMALAQGNTPAAVALRQVGATR